MDLIRALGPWSRTLDEALTTVDCIGEYVKKNSLSPTPGIKKVLQAVIAAEDHRYLKHHGVDWIAVFRVFARYMLKGEISGGSTIEQQLVRTIRQRYEFTIRRKLSEMAIAMIVGHRVLKDDVIMTYISVAYFGWQATGIVQAAIRLGIRLNSANEREAATLAAMLKIPMPRYPSEEYAARLARRISYIRKRIELTEPRG